ncbi:MAG: alanine racemase [Solirubrobacteraceae bacterium]|nr:alanine racemase [Solirubrobacteraceae bacterium]
MPLRALARVNLAAIERNVARLQRDLQGAALCAVVKADGYGHGAVPVARAAVQAGAGWLAVATVDEATQLREAGISTRLLVMGAISADELPAALRTGADLVAWSGHFVRDVAAQVGPDAPARIHVKFDTGLGRLGTRDLEEALSVARQVIGCAPATVLAGAMTHFATADDDPEFVAAQLQRFAPFVAQMRQLADDVVVHAANSAATLTQPASLFDLVRCGIAIYGSDPMNEDPDDYGLEPALELCSYLAAVKPAGPGDSAGYGRRFIAREPTVIGTVPVGYGDGIRRALSNNCDVLVGGRRYPLVGTVSMDNLTIDLGASPSAAVGDRVTIIGRDGAERQTAEQLARRIETISYEVLCGISGRVPRRYHRDGEAG